MSVEIISVSSHKELKAFVQFYYDLYRSCPSAVPFLFSDEMKTLDKTKNPAFEFCDAKYFLAYKDGRLCGRIAGIVNHRANDYWQSKAIRFGWFDFVDDPEVSSALLQAVAKWGASQGLTLLVGPMGFEDMDREGLLVEGFDEISSMYVNYNYPYYQEHLERLGFVKDNDYVEYKVKVPEVTPQKFARTAEMVEKRYGLQTRKFNRHDMVEGRRAYELFDVLNITYKDLYGFSHLSSSQIKRLVEEYISLADLNLVSCVVDTRHNDKLVGFGVSFPSFSRALRRTRDGRLWPMGWWHMLKVLKWHKTSIVDLLLIGVLPEYRVKGANALIFTDLIGWYQKYNFKYAQTGPQMETNKGVLSQWQYLDAECNRRHRVYIKHLE